MLGGGGNEGSAMPVVYPRGTLSFSSLSSYFSVGSSYKPSHPSLPIFIVVHHIQEYSNKKRGKKLKYINQQEEKVGNEDQIKQMRVKFQAKLVVGY